MLTNKKTGFFIFFLALSITLFGQTKKDTTSPSLKKAELELKLALSEQPQDNISQKRTIIKDSLTAVKYAETILFSIYGKVNIEFQKPYNINFIDKYWILSGNLPKGYVGGTFLIIFDSRDCKVIKIIHGK